MSQHAFLFWFSCQSKLRILARTGKNSVSMTIRRWRLLQSICTLRSRQEKAMFWMILVLKSSRRFKSMMLPANGYLIHSFWVMRTCSSFGKYSTFESWLNVEEKNRHCLVDKASPLHFDDKIHLECVPAFHFLSHGAVVALRRRHMIMIKCNFTFRKEI